MTELEKPWVPKYTPGGALIVPEGDERVGDVSNVAFSNGAIVCGNEVYIYYASSDTRCHVATSSIEQLVDYCKNTPEDPLWTANCVQLRNELIKKNLEENKELTAKTKV